MDGFGTLTLIIALVIEIYIIFKFFELFSRVKKLEMNQKEIINKIRGILGIDEEKSNTARKEEFNKPEDWLR